MGGFSSFLQSFLKVLAPFNGVLTDANYNTTVQINGAVTLPSTHRAGGIIQVINPSSDASTVSCAQGDFIYYPPGGNNSSSGTTSVSIAGGTDAWFLSRGSNEWDIISGSYLDSVNQSLSYGNNGGTVVTIKATNSSYGRGLVIDGNGGGNGTEIALLGDGAQNTATPDKYLRSNSGNFQVLNSAYSQAILTVSDSGSANILGEFDLGGDVVIHFNSATQKGLRLLSNGVSGISTQSSRWYIYADGIAESGSNTGSNYSIGRFDDSGTWIDSPVLIRRNTGVTYFSQPPQHPAPAQFDSSGQSATTSFVQGALGNRSGVIVVGSTVTLDASAYGTAIQFMNNSAVTVTLPAQPSQAGGTIRFYHQGQTSATIAAPSGVNIFIVKSGVATNVPSITMNPGDLVELLARGGSGVEWDVIGGNMRFT